jgi:hypothetical protein
VAMAYDFSPEEAARRLDAELRPHSWYTSTGVGTTTDGPVLFVYVRTGNHRQLSKLGNKWMGYPLLVRTVGRVRAVA